LSAVERIDDPFDERPSKTAHLHGLAEIMAMEPAPSRQLRKKPSGDRPDGFFYFRDYGLAPGPLVVAGPLASVTPPQLQRIAECTRPGVGEEAAPGYSAAAAMRLY
jgi:hypothetical protein